jgi:hypothetical protein
MLFRVQFEDGSQIRIEARDLVAAASECVSSTTPIPSPSKNWTPGPGGVRGRGNPLRGSPGLGGAWGLRIGQGGRAKRSNPEATRDAVGRWLQARGASPGPLFVNFDRTGRSSGALQGELAGLVAGGVKVQKRLGPTATRFSGCGRRRYLA